jgi:ABC-2 type transport system permease protein
MVADLLKLNLALLFSHLFIAGICFLFSCIFSQSNYSLTFGAGIPTLMYIFQMLANVGKKAQIFKYFTFFTLFDPNSIVAKEAGAFIGPIILFVGAIALYLLGGVIFCKKDMSL